MNIEEALMQGQLLPEAFACGKPELRNVAVNIQVERITETKSTFNNYNLTC